MSDEKAEPAERIDPLEGRDRARRHALAADAVKAVAAGDEIALDLVRLAVVRDSVTRGLRAVEVVQA